MITPVNGNGDDDVQYFIVRTIGLLCTLNLNLYTENTSSVLLLCCYSPTLNRFHKVNSCAN